MPILAFAAIAIFAFAAATYSIIQTRKLAKKNKPKPSQLDNALADEGVSTCRIGGSPHIYGNCTDIWDQSTEEIKQKSGGK